MFERFRPVLQRALLEREWSVTELIQSMINDKYTSPTLQ